MLTMHQVGLLLLVLWSISSLHQEALGGRYLVEEVAEENWARSLFSSTRSGENEADDDHGFVATINREVPSGPDPLHN
uniref:Uncharacterized protein n=1 Tax=Kalanchoe fedtschenkoi TaxID=63787 RepID=A0A7N0V7X0_KALFE